MGQRGPKKQASRLRVLRGNPGKRPVPNEAKPGPAVLKCPAGLGASGSALWRRLAPKLLREGLLTEVDRELFIVLCDTWELYQKAKAKLGEQEITRYSDNGIEYLNPVIKLIEKCRADLQRLANHFGLSPLGRCGLDVSGGGEGHGESWTLD